MESILLTGARVVTPADGVVETSILVRGGIIAEIGVSSAAAEETLDLEGSMLLPGFIDIHNHGAVGVDVNEASAEDLREVGRFLAQNGVTSWMPTFVPDSVEVYGKVTSAMREVISTQEFEAAAQIVGVHYEGIFANTQMCGALRPEYFRTFAGNELDDIPEIKGAAHLTTFAPEVSGGIDLVKALTSKGWIASIGHTRADVTTLDAAFAAGAKHVTHLFNAMTGLHHRDVGVVGWVLANEGISADIIADGIHVDSKVLKIAFDAKTSDRLMLISDSVAPTGQGDGEFDLWGERISVTGGRTCNERGSIAGSVITMNEAVKTFLKIGVGFDAAARMASSNPAKLLGLTDRGSIEKGKRADLVALDPSGELKLSLVGGKIARKVG